MSISKNLQSLAVPSRYEITGMRLVRVVCRYKVFSCMQSLVRLLFFLETQYVGFVHEVVGRLPSLEVLEDSLGARLDQQVAQRFHLIAAHGVVQCSAFQL